MTNTWNVFLMHKSTVIAGIINVINLNYNEDIQF